jgi:hypothetical protein
MENTSPKPIPFIRRLCAHRTEEEILDAEERFRRYIALVVRICERMEEEELAGIQQPEPASGDPEKDDRYDMVLHGDDIVFYPKGKKTQVRQSPSKDVSCD